MANLKSVTPLSLHRKIPPAILHGVLENLRDHRGMHRPLYTVRFDLSEVSTVMTGTQFGSMCMKSG